jgi:hypothetical protein
MTTVRIPDWNHQGLLPPNDAVDPTSAERSPYTVSLTDFVLHFGTTKERQTILQGLLGFRAVLHAAGLNNGFQWVDGSFLENIEKIENRAPADMDVVTFFHLPPRQTQQSFASAHPDLFNHADAKTRFHVDAYFVPMDDNPPACLVERSAYWYSLWSHRRNGQWAMEGILADRSFGNRRPDGQSRTPESSRGRSQTMNIQEKHQLLAEKTSLERMLAGLPESSVIDRMSLEARKAEVEKALAAVPFPSREPVRVRLTFRGKPIIGSHGMFAEFGAKAINAFAEAVAAIGASQTTALGTRGALPNREAYQLLITGTAVGSFGFELEEAPGGETLFPELSLVDQAIMQTRKIMEASLGSDDELTEAIADADPRAVGALRGFLQTLADHEAVCALEFNEDAFRFADVAQVRRSEGRLRQDNIHEEEKSLSGHFLGVLPHRRTFEFEVAETQEIIAGKVGPDIENAGSINQVLGQDITIQVHSKRAGTGRPRYTLLSYKETETMENSAKNYD